MDSLTKYLKEVEKTLNETFVLINDKPYSMTLIYLNQ